MDFNIAIIKGDGIGSEIVTQALRVLDKIGESFGHHFFYQEALMGGCAYDQTGVPLPDETIRICKESDSVLLGAVGGEKWNSLPANLRPEKGLLELRSALGLYANLRPAVLSPALRSECPLRADIAAQGFDMLIVRELTGGIYFGERGRRQGPMGEEAYDIETYSQQEIQRIGKVAFEMAGKRQCRVISVDKANVLESSRLWREEMHKLKESYPHIAYSDMLVDNAAMQLVRNPAQFDVVVTSNLFGDILSDEASMITGSIGLLPSASLGDGKRGLYEPIHGSAPDIAGTGTANPIATISSAAMMLRYSFDLAKEAEAIESAINAALNAGYRTADIVGASGSIPLSTTEMTDRVLEAMDTGD